MRRASRACGRRSRSTPSASRIRGAARTHAALSFSVREGETVAIVGPSGAGKSTIVRLLLRRDAQGGAIRIGGHDVRTLDAGKVREMIAVVAQDATLFDGSVADNLRLGPRRAMRT